MLFLLRLNIRKNPAPAPSRRRVLSPASGSTLITSAPRSPRIIPQVGPMTMWENSITRTPASGSAAGRASSVIERNTFRHGRACPGHDVGLEGPAEVVDTRHKAGHDETGIPASAPSWSRRLAEARRQSGPRDAAVERTARQRLFEDAPRFDQFLKIDPGSQPHALQHEDDVFGRDIAGRARGERA